MRSRPNRMPNSSRERMYRSASSGVIRASVRWPTGASQRLQLGPEPLQLLALGLDDLRRRLVHESLVGELALGPFDLSLELGPPGGQPALRALQIDLVARQDLDRAPRHGHAPHRLR